MDHQNEIGLTVQLEENQALVLYKKQLPDTEVIQFESQGLIETSKDLVVVTHEEYLVAGKRVMAFKAMIKEIKERFEKAKKTAKQAHTDICDLENSFLDPLKLAMNRCDAKVTAYVLEDRRRERERVEAARKVAEEEAKKKAEEVRKAAEEARIAKAVELEAAGKTAQAERIMEAPPVPTVVKRVAIPKAEEKEKVKGLSVRVTWKAVVTDLMLLVQEVAAGRQPLDMLLPNMTTLNQAATSWKDKLMIPGVESEDSAASSSRG